MWDRYGLAVVEERREDRRLGALRAYLQTEYGSASGTEWYLAEANHTSSPRLGVRTFLARIAGLVSKSSTLVATSTASVEPALSEECAEPTTPHAPRVTPASARPMRYRGGHNLRPRTVVPPLKR